MLYNSLSYNGIQYNIIQDTVIYSNIIEGSLEVKLPTIWTVGRAEVGRVREEKKRSEKIREERRCRCAKGRKVAIHCVFPMSCGSGGSKGRLAKAAGAEPCVQMRNWKLHTVGEAHLEVQKLKTPPVRTTFGSWDVEKVHPVVARSTFMQVKSVKNWRIRTTIGSWDVEKVHAIVARSTCPNQKCQKLRFLSLFWGSDVEKVHTNWFN